MDPIVLILTFAALACVLAAPDTTTLVTLEVRSPGGNDSVSPVQVRSRLYFPLYLFLNPCSDPLSEGRTWKWNGLTLDLKFIGAAFAFQTIKSLLGPIFQTLYFRQYRLPLHTCLEITRMVPVQVLVLFRCFVIIGSAFFCQNKKCCNGKALKLLVWLKGYRHKFYLCFVIVGSALFCHNT